MDRFPHQNEDIPEENQVSRRAFLLSLAGMGVAFSTEGSTLDERDADFAETDTLAFDFKYKQLHFREYTELPDHVQNIVRVVVDHMNEFVKMSSMAMSADSMNKTHVYSPDNAQDIPERYTALQKSFWVRMKNYMPDLPEYSLEAYRSLVIEKIPVLLAEHGIFAKTVVKWEGDIRTNKAIVCQPLLSLAKITKVTSDVTECWRRRMPREIIHISTLDEYGVQEVGSSTIEYGTGQTYYQTVIVPALQKERPAMTPHARETFATVSALPYEELYKMVMHQPDASNARRVAWSACAGNIYTRYMPSQQPPGAHEQSIIAHETGHLYDQRDSYFVQSFRPVLSGKFVEDQRLSFNHSIHEEINGFLAQLRYSESRYEAVVDVLGTEDDDAHAIAESWIRTELVAEIRSNPKKYGITIIGTDNLDVQIILQLDRFFFESPYFNAVIEKLHALHEEQYHVNLTPAGYLSSLGANDSSGENKASPLTPTGIGLAAATVASALYWFHTRKQKVQQQTNQKGKNKK